MDPIEALMSPATEEDQLKALAQQLRGSKQAADFFALSSIDPISKMAQGRQKEILGTAEQQGVLRKALADRKSREAESQADRDAADARNDASIASRENVARINGTGLGTSKYGQWVQKDKEPPKFVSLRGNQFFEAGSNVPIDMTGYVAAGTPMSDKAKQDIMQDIPKALNDHMDLIGALDVLDDKLAPHSIEQGGSTAVADIPGFGEFSSQKGMVGKIARVGERMGGEKESSSNAAAAERLRNLLIKEGAGKTQTLSEIAAQERQLDRSILGDPAVFAENLGWIKETLKNEIAGEIAALPDWAREEYNAKYTQLYGDDERFVNPVTWRPRSYTFVEETDPVKKTISDVERISKMYGTSPSQSTPAPSQSTSSPYPPDWGPEQIAEWEADHG